MSPTRSFKLLLCIILILILYSIFAIKKELLFFNNSSGTKQNLDFEILNIDKDCIIANEIESIRHFHESQIIQISFVKERQCRNPALLGRLSGPALSLLQSWQWTRNNSDTIQASYRLPYKGLCYLEIIAIFCNNIVSEEELKDKCVLELPKNRRTDKNSTIIVSKSSKYYFESPGIGFWVHENLLHNAAKNHLNLPNFLDVSPPSQEELLNKKRNMAMSVYYHPVLTRYQSLDCVQRNACDEKQSLISLDQYYFVFNEKTNNLVSTLFHFWKNDLLRSHYNYGSNLCFVGASHAKMHSLSYLRIFNQSFEFYEDHLIYARFSEVIIEKLPEIIQKKCNKVIISVGQWDIQWPRGYPTLFSQFEKDVEKMLRAMIDFGDKEALKSNLSYFDIYVRSVHPRPLAGKNYGNVICPAHGWNFMPSVQQYNEVLQRVTMKLSLPFLNTSHIINTIWDAASDWGHYGHKGHIDNHVGGRAGDAEIIYLLGKVNNLF